MRLTLRTLLAYMDEILEPGDREELSKKIETSDFANDLILRTKDTTRRLRLSAPQVVGTGMGLDPNTVAEYLDNTLPPDAVADFERICLESDVHLAEVASAHHVLTMVLGEPAEVDPQARQRMYGIPAEAERLQHMQVEPPVATPAVAHAAVTPPPRMAPAAATFAPAKLRHQEVPDYLRASSWSGSRLALGALAAALLIGTGAMFIYGLNGWRNEPVALNGGAALTSTPTPPPISDEEPAETADASMSESQLPIAASPAAEAPAVVNQLAGTPPRLTLPSMTGEEPAPQEPPAAEQPTEPAPEAGVAVSEPPPTEPDPYAVDAGSDVTSAVASSVPVTTAPPMPPQSTPTITPLPPVDAASPHVVTTPADETPRVASSTVVPPAADTVAVGSAPAAITEQPAGNSELGTYLDGKNVLLHYSPTDQSWYRMSPRTMIHSGDRLLALPAFHPKVTLASGLFLKLTGGSLVAISNGSASDTVEIDLAFGRVVIVNTANDDNRVQLKLGATDATATLKPNATLAIEVMPSYVAGVDPREAQPAAAVNIFVRDGSVIWQEGTASETVNAPIAWAIKAGVVADRTTEPIFPEWIDHEPVEQRSEQMFGAPAIEAALDPSRPVEDQLLELYQHSKRREVKSLAARSSMYVGQFVPFVEALRDSDQKSTWKTHIDTLRSAMSLGPDSADKIYETLVEQRGEQPAHDLYEMLCGYSKEQIGTTPDQVKTGALLTLVDRLENDSLDYRVLASQDLWEITGMRLMPNPAGSPAERARGLRIWRERLNSGEVTPTAQAQQ